LFRKNVVVAKVKFFALLFYCS